MRDFSHKLHHDGKFGSNGFGVMRSASLIANTDPQVSPFTTQMRRLNYRSPKNPRTVYSEPGMRDTLQTTFIDITDIACDIILYFIFFLIICHFSEVRLSVKRV